VLVEQADEIASLLAPGGEQRLRVQVQQFVGQNFRHALPPRLAGAPAPQQIPVGDDVGPVMLQGLCTHISTCVQRPSTARTSSDCCGRLEMPKTITRRGRPAGVPPRASARRSAGRPRAPPPARHSTPPCAPPTAGPLVVPATSASKRAPQRCLPALSRRPAATAPARVDQHILARRPGRQPVGAIHLILIEEVGKAFGKLEALAPIAVAVRKPRSGAYSGIVHHFRQQAHQAPEQPRLVERRTLRHRLPSEQRAIDLPQKARRQRNFERRRDAAAPGFLPLPCGIGGERQLEPLRDAIALHQDDLVLERRQRIALHPGDDQVAQQSRGDCRARASGQASLGGNGQSRVKSGSGQVAQPDRPGE
jgi:hypothetical protein